MRLRVFAVAMAAVFCSLPMLAQDIPPGPDVWDSLGGGSTDVTLSANDWKLLCGVTVGDTAVQLKGFNIAGLGTGDTQVDRLQNASLPAIGSSASVDIQLVALSLVNDGTHPCSPLTIRVKPEPGVTQALGKMIITKTSAAGGTFSATVFVDALVEAVDSSGVVKGSTTVGGSLGDASPSPWSYAPPTAAAASSPWHPGVDPATLKPVRVCRIGNKTLPARHCYRPRPKCKVQPAPVDTNAARDADAVIIAIEPCSIEAEPAPTTN